MESVQAILANARQAMGGDAAVAAATTIDALAACTGPGGRFCTRIYSARDGRMTMMQGDANGRRMLNGIDLVDGWMQRPGEPGFAVPSEQSRTFLRGHELHMTALDPESRFSDPTIIERSEFAGQASVTVRFSDDLGGDLDIHYERDSGLPRGLSQKNHLGNGAPTIDVTFRDWTTTQDDLRFFSRATFAHGDDIYEYEFVRISVNDVDDILLRSPEREASGADAALLRHIHNQQQTAHLTHDAGLFTSTFHDPVLLIGDGSISESSRSERRERSQGYFDQVEFVAWDDVDPPIIRVSADGTMATNLVRKHVHLAVEDSNGVRQEESTQFAWMESWEKLAGVWQLMAVASTNE